MCIAYQSGSKTIDYVKLSDELGNEITLDGCKIINIKDATTANADWADMGYDLPPYLIGDSDIDPKFLNIQKIYDSLYLDDGKEFKYIGFKEAEKRENFFRELLLVINLLKNKLNDEYIIEDNMDFLKKTIN